MAQILDDADPDALISRLSRPLNVADRDAFRTAAQDALTRLPCWGEGALYRSGIAAARLSRAAE